MNHTGSHPEYFEELCALAATGQISETEFVELQDHMQACASCRTTYADFMDLFHSKLPLIDPELTRFSRIRSMLSEESSYFERFLTRARKEGIAISREPLPKATRKLGIWWAPVRLNQGAALAITFLLAIVVAMLSYSLRQSDVRYRALAADMVKMSGRLNQQETITRGVPDVTPAISPPAAAWPSKPAPELIRARRDAAAAEARAKMLQDQLEQLQTTAIELQASKAQLEEAKNSRNQLANSLVETERAAANANRELQTLRDSRSRDAATMAGKDAEIRRLEMELNDQSEALHRERTLLAAGRDIHDLMGARNLHIVDVLDVDSKGKDQRAFGRVFYTEGKSLIFYAFDLGDRGTAKRDASFQVWGARGAAQKAAQNLGIFYVDDQKQNRWLLKFEDPAILAEIDSVFVTVEPRGGSAKPTGHKLLYAYLKVNPNHP
jgi:Anti-sigma-K factor rskA, C-terminal